MSPQTAFEYDQAFNRNLGWFTEGEQLALRGKRVAIAGMGGVGGVHLLTLVRLGIGGFHIADFDRFDLANFNRQAGANMQAIMRPKAEVMEEMAFAINPDLLVRRFDEGVTEENLEEFLSGVDLFVDGLDFFVIDIRRRIFARCHDLGIPAVTAAPIGMGTGFLAFVPKGMSFEQYFRLNGQPENEQYLRFLMGLVPRGLHRTYLVDPSRLNLATKTGPSTIAACQLCAGVTAVMAVKLLLRRGDVKPAPWHHHYDAYRGILARTWLPFGNAGPVQRLKLTLSRRALKRARPTAPPPFHHVDTIDEILHAARWAPSGDNEQPWQFEKLGNETVRVHLASQNKANPYEYRDGEPLLLAGGMLLETLRIAASAHQREMLWEREDTPGPSRLLVRFQPADASDVDPLYSFLGLRSVDRTKYRARTLTDAERQALEASLGDNLRIDWYPTLAARWRFARLSALATDIRLRAPETFPIHQQVIDWDVTLSPTKIPAGALGLRPSTIRIMRWAMRDWGRMQRLNRITGTGSAALEMDYGPILSSAAVFALRLRAEAPQPRGSEQMLNAGMNIQRFWLTATKLGLAMQPALAVLIFAHYGQHDIAFTTDSKLRAKAKRLAGAFQQVLGASPDEFLFMGRIGEPRPKNTVIRSTRRSLAELIITPKA